MVKTGQTALDQGGRTSDIDALFLSLGQLGRDLRAVDWAATPLGPPRQWPQSLKSTLQLMLTSRFSMWMAWGPQLTFFANEAYCRATLAKKYPWALGKPAQDVWSEIWPEIGPRIDGVLSTGIASWDESLPLILERSGFPEETYHTFSYSPLADEAGDIVGMLCIVSEETSRVINERRMRILRDLGSALAGTRTEEDVYATLSTQLGSDLRKIPFSVVYRIDDDGSAASLVSAAGVAPGDSIAPESIKLGGSSRSWPLVRAMTGDMVLVEDLAERFVAVPKGDWDEPAASAVLLPLMNQAGERPYGVLVAALNRYRPFNQEYRWFLRLITNEVAASIATARAYESQRVRAEALAELDRAKTTFFTNVSHELRTPLTLLLGPASDALGDLDSPLPPAQRERVELIYQNGGRLLKLVNSVLDFSRLESGKETARLERVDLGLYTAQLASMFRAAVERAGLRLEIDCETLDADTFVDREMWAKIVSNLLSNALKFTFEGSIVVSLRQHRAEGAPARVELQVSDTGTGIRQADQALLFERFQRVEGASSRSFEGSGIGLALVAELVNLHGGHIEARSEPGQGSTFVVDLPAGEPQDKGSFQVSDRQADPPPVEELTSGFVDEAMRWLDNEGKSGLDGQGERQVVGSESLDRRRILIVEDNADMRRYLASLLASSYQLDMAPDGAVALSMVRSAPPDLVLTDVMMPNLDGFGLLAALRADPATARVPVIMLSAQAGESAAVVGLDAGADDYLVKPFSAPELLARVRSTLELERTRREVAALEGRIAAELQASLIPVVESRSETLVISSYYQAGVHGTQVGGDWYDVIELGAGQTGLVIGDVMGRGVRAAAIMGRVREALRAYASTGLSPADVLEHLDTTVSGFDGSQIVTCFYAVYDEFAKTFSFSNAGHLPVLCSTPKNGVARLGDALGPPLGVAPARRFEARTVLEPGSTVVLYTDGLVEQRGSDLDARIDEAAAFLEARRPPVEAISSALVDHLCPDGSDDDIAVLVAHIPVHSPRWERFTATLPFDETAAARAREAVAETLATWSVDNRVATNVVLIASELVTNAVQHGRPPVTLRLSRTTSELLLEVIDTAGHVPRVLRPGPADDHGRGLHLVSTLAEKWGTRMTEQGKAVWCTVPFPAAELAD